MKINCIVVDDEPLARKGLTNFISDIPYLNLTGVFSNPVDALPAIQEQKTDLVFLDIHMPKMNGLDFLKSLTNPPITIITTAFPNHALESYELNVMDYLIKPIPFERFMKATNKAKEYCELQQRLREGKSLSRDYFFIRCEGRYEKVLYSELLYVEALQNYVMLHTKSKKFISYLTFKSVEEYLPEDLFIKVNKSYIVSLAGIDSVEGSEIKIGNKEITISRTLKEDVLGIILKNKLFRK